MFSPDEIHSSQIGNANSVAISGRADDVGADYKHGLEMRQLEWPLFSSSIVPEILKSMAQGLNGQQAGLEGKVNITVCTRTPY